MLWKLLKAVIWAFRPHKHGYSLKGFWGQTIHFDKNGKQIGYTVRGFWRQRKRYDMDNNLISVSWRNFWGGYDTYDAEGNLIKRSHRNFGGGFTTVDHDGKEIMRTYETMGDDFDRLDIDDCDIMVHIEPEETKHEKSKNNNKMTRNMSELPKTSVGGSVHKSVSKNVLVTTLSENEETAKVMQNLEELNRQTVDKTVVYDSVEEYLALHDKNHVKILAFSYGELKEFPACVTEKDSKLLVVPLLKGVSSFEVDRSEIQTAQKKVIKGLDMSVVDNEFVNLGASGLVGEFKELFPDYIFSSEGMERVQYELKCGLVVTENSWIKLKEQFE